MTSDKQPLFFQVRYSKQQFLSIIYLPLSFHVNFTLAPLILYFSITTLLVLLFRYYFPRLSKIVTGSALPLILLSIGATKMMFAIATKEINLL